MKNHLKKLHVRFSLRTLLVVMTLLAVGLGWQANIVRERKTLLASLEAYPNLDFEPLGTIFTSTSTVEFNRIVMNKPLASLPWYRAWLGDRAISAIALPQEMPRDAVQRFEDAFPEAWISQEVHGRRLVTRLPPQ